MYTFWYQRDYKETVDYSLLYIFVYCELNMQEWVSIYETDECDIGAPDIHRFSWVDGLSTGPPGFRASQNKGHVGGKCHMAECMCAHVTHGRRCKCHASCLSLRISIWVTHYQGMIKGMISSMEEEKEERKKGRK